MCHPVIRKAYRQCDHAEHFGTILIACCDAFELHHVIWVVSLWVVIVGVPSFIQDCKGA